MNASIESAPAHVIRMVRGQATSDGAGVRLTRVIGGPALPEGHNAFAYVFEGAGNFRDASRPTGVLLEKEVRGEEVNIRDLSGNRTLIRFGAGDEVTVQAGPQGVRFLLISGAPLREPVAWHGPIVMNTEAEIRQAITELRNGTFIKPAH